MLDALLPTCIASSIDEASIAALRLPRG